MTHVQRIELDEHTRHVATAASKPTDADERFAERLGPRGEGPARLDVRWLTSGNVEITATSWVGVVRFSSLEVHVVPKLVGGNLQVLRMLEYALGVRMLRRLPTQRTVASQGHDLLDLVCLLLLEETQALLRDGLLREYREADDDLQMLRGRLRYRDQYLRRFGQLDRLECRFDEYDSDNPDNQLLAAGLDAARRTANDPDIRFTSLRLARLLLEACEPRTADAHWYERAIRYTRRNVRYRPAHELSKLLLRQLAFDDMFNTSSRGLTAFMINMNTVFERFVLRLVDEALTETSALTAAPHQRLRAVIRDDDTGRTYTTLDPDLIVQHSGTGERVPIDVKYKLYESKKLASGDIYQAFLYAFALGRGGLHRAGIIFPATSAATGPTLSIRQLEGPTAAKIVVVGLDVPQALDHLAGPRRIELLAVVRTAVEQLTGLRGSEPAVSA